MTGTAVTVLPVYVEQSSTSAPPCSTKSVAYNSPHDNLRWDLGPYNDVPRIRYRRIAAKGEESPSHLQFFVEISEGQPFEIKGSAVQIVLCRTKSEAIAKAEQERDSSLHSGWREYPDAPL